MVDLATSAQWGAPLRSSWSHRCKEVNWRSCRNGSLRLPELSWEVSPIEDPQGEQRVWVCEQEAAWLTQRAGCLGACSQLISILLAELMPSQGIGVFFPLVCDVRCQVDDGQLHRAQRRGLCLVCWVGAESQNSTFLLLSHSALSTLRDLHRLEVASSYTNGKCFCVFDFNGRQRLRDSIPPLKCQTSHCF